MWFVPLGNIFRPINQEMWEMSRWMCFMQRFEDMFRLQARVIVQFYLLIVRVRAWNLPDRQYLCFMRGATILQRKNMQVLSQKLSRLQQYAGQLPKV